MGAQTEWLPAKKFENIDNWDDSLKPAASHYIKQVEEWIISMDGCEEGKGYKCVGDAIPTITKAVAQKDKEQHQLFRLLQLVWSTPVWWYWRSSHVANVERHLLKSQT